MAALYAYIFFTFFWLNISFIIMGFFWQEILPLSQLEIVFAARFTAQDESADTHKGKVIHGFVSATSEN